jgi:hypothetical protein
MRFGGHKIDVLPQSRAIGNGLCLSLELLFPGDVFHLKTTHCCPLGKSTDG